MALLPTMAWARFLVPSRFGNGPLPSRIVFIFGSLVCCKGRMQKRLRKESPSSRCRKGCNGGPRGLFSGSALSTPLRPLATAGALLSARTLFLPSEHPRSNRISISHDGRSCSTARVSGLSKLSQSSAEVKSRTGSGRAYALAVTAPEALCGR